LTIYDVKEWEFGQLEDSTLGIMNREHRVTNLWNWSIVTIFITWNIFTDQFEVKYAMWILFWLIRGFRSSCHRI